MSINDNIIELEGKKNRKRKTKRDGRSVTHDINRVPTKDLRAMGFEEQAAKLILNARRVLPVVEDPMEPQIDAQKLWKRIGKPHGQFRFWADHYIKPIANNEEISSKIEKTGKRGRPAANYTLSRSVAADLAMQANTPEGAEIRRYFLLMESVVLKLANRNQLRGERIIGIDNAIHHHATKTFAEAGVKGLALKGAVNSEEQRLKSKVSVILTGFRAGYWSDLFGCGIRDVLDNDDLATYESAYKTVEVLLKAGKADDAELKSILGPTFSRAIDMRPYLETKGLDPDLADVKKHIATSKVKRNLDTPRQMDSYF
ncbi:hypothetical protein [Thiorhodococcus fuscus]|uniref:AntA/AntB antirepressor domain-containing protein n=1 Tax=Thiorhodococcus fuscus TaxID=527200 RepID=A0ABW4Y6U6_9GAMM